MTDAPDLADGSLARAEALLDLGRPKDALAVLAPALAARPDDVGLLHAQATALVGLGELGKAEETLLAALRHGPDDPHSSYLLSAVHRVRGNNAAEALRYARRAVALAPFNPAYQAHLAECLAALPDGHTEAVAVAERAIELAPHWAGAHVALADVLYPEGMKKVPRARLARAEDHLLRALELEPGSAIALNDLARVQIARGKEARAAGNLARAAGTDPRLAVLHSNMDVVLGNHIVRSHWVLFVLWIMMRSVATSRHTVPRWIPVSLACVAAALIAFALLNLYRRVGTTLPAFLRGFARRRRLRAAWGLCLLAALVGFVATAVAPFDRMGWFLASAGLPLFAGAALSWIIPSRERAAGL